MQKSLAHGGPVMRKWAALLVLVPVLCAGCLAMTKTPQQAAGLAEAQGSLMRSRHVPRLSRENHCGRLFNGRLVHLLPTVGVDRSRSPRP